jgi:uncharacterized protein YndB with AHSA1/START domain
VSFVIEDSAVIARPIERVFGFMSDHTNLPKWTVGVLRSRRTAGEGPGHGARYELTGKSPFGEVPGTYVVTGWEPGRRFEGHFDSKMFAFDEVYTFERADQGTRVHLRAEVQPRGFIRILAFLLRRDFNRQIHEDHLKLKALLEAEGGSSSS